MAGNTIGNPLSWIFGRAVEAESHLESVVESMAGESEDGVQTLPKVNTITVDDIRESLRLGVADFTALRSDVVFLCVLYPIIGLFLFWAVFEGNLLALLAPIISGFALVGPVAGVGLYEMSRRREKGMKANWSSAIEVFRAPSFGSIFVLGVFLFMTFAVWLAAASGIYNFTLGPEAPASMGVFIMDVLTTSAGWAMAIVGTAVGFVFAVFVLAISVASFPLLLDRNVGLPIAVATSMQVARTNPVPIGIWGMIVAGSLALGSLPALLGLVFVVPILGHSTWHLYRRCVSND